MALNREKQMGYFGEDRLRFLLPVTIGKIQPLPSLKHIQAVPVDDYGRIQLLVRSISDDWNKKKQKQRRAV